MVAQPRRRALTTPCVVSEQARYAAKPDEPQTAFLRSFQSCSEYAACLQPRDEGRRLSGMPRPDIGPIQQGSPLGVMRLFPVQAASPITSRSRPARAGGEMSARRGARPDRQVESRRNDVGARRRQEQLSHSRGKARGDMRSANAGVRSVVPDEARRAPWAAPAFHPRVDHHRSATTHLLSGLRVLQHAENQE